MSCSFVCTTDSADLITDIQYFWKDWFIVGQRSLWDFNIYFPAFCLNLWPFTGVIVKEKDIFFTKGFLDSGCLTFQIVDFTQNRFFSFIKIF